MTTIKRSEVQLLVAAITALDRPIVVSEESDEVDGKKTSVKKREVVLTFDGEVRLDLGRNLHRLRSELEAINHATQGLFREAAVGDNVVINAEANQQLVGQAAVDFSRSVQDLLSKTVELDLIPIKLSRLKSEKIKMPEIPLEILSILLDRILVD